MGRHLSRHHDPNALGAVLWVRHEAVGHHFDVALIRLEELPAAPLAGIFLLLVIQRILWPVEAAPDAGDDEVEFGVRELHAQALPRALGEGHEETLEAGVVDEAFGFKGEGVGEDGRVEVDEGGGHADWCLVVARKKSGALAKIDVGLEIGTRGFFNKRGHELTRSTYADGCAPGFLAIVECHGAVGVDACLTIAGAH